MVRNRKQSRTADLVAGIIVVLVALGLLLAVLFAVDQWREHLAEAQQPTTTAPISTPAPTKPPAPTLMTNPFASDDFAYDTNGYMGCLTAEYLLGVDVSEYQKKINWEKVASSGVDFAMVRLGYRGWGAEGVLREDARGLDNLRGAKEAGLLVGVYFFSQAITVEEAVEEARFVLDLLNGQSLDLPIVFDWETVSSQDARTANMKRSTLNACAQAFCREIEAAGYQPMVYFNLDMSRWMFDLLALQEAGCDFWLAMYSDSLTYRYGVRMWQYTDSGKVSGIDGRVDMNLYFPELSRREE